MDSQRKSRSKSTAATTCIKLLLHIFNFLYMIIGICILAVGIWTQIELKEYMEITGLYYANSAYVMIGVGVMILLVAVCGFYCTAKDKIAPLYLYGIFIALLAIVQLAAGIAGGAYAGALDSAFNEGLTNSIKESSPDMDAWNKVQETLGCCGVNNYSDWETMAGRHAPASCYEDGKLPVKPNTTTSLKPPITTTSTTSTSTIVTTPTTPDNSSETTTSEMTTSAPNSNDTLRNTTTGPATTPATAPATTTSLATTPATAPATTTAPATVTTPKNGSRKKREVSSTVYEDGCHSKVTTKVKDYLGVIVGVCIGFVALQVVGAMLACCLAKKTSKNNYEQIY